MKGRQPVEVEKDKEMGSPLMPSKETLILELLTSITVK